MDKKDTVIFYMYNTWNKECEYLFYPRELHLSPLQVYYLQALT